ncbi:MAG: phosphatase PAP2 family protein, partial [Actinobacteria bacterium]|nr:phosphatase PAP2 family protein [Actinomycetota bacterium]NIS37041.1 phosphatase PAP2 family protein [Actinomycetota bacterium]NIT99059.1 phosphatase PAP2 family protein [Actinomycetota bacterium]NIU22673.1 phosphatase PAP2 family protein [Actinomycetota bacterium]NIU71501.1 phosphatase PAP2 family protein [Actinomycetota bacterium]
AGAVVVGLVGFSRLAIGVHYPSDILAGWLWVGAWAALVWPGPR